MNENELKTRCQKMIKEMGIPKTKFADHSKIGRSTYYAWQSGRITLSDVKLAGIINFLEKYGF